MKQTKKQVVFYEVEKRGFLKSYKDRENLAFEAAFTDDLRDALYLSVEPYEEQKTELDKLAEAFGCEVLIVEVEYNVTKLDGSDFEHTEREKSMKDGIEALLELLAK
ncbi:hypothetical protein CQA85_01785 [Streptococcus salivarius]|uniref:hypothetical protein n=1 Tax=Streptococcus salivarius TaxID=1304 RepID=UPI000BCBBEE8|nr:hypothetical protein [Streptococcus salivarius]PCR83387.1 hypothetical protein CQA85_01785 [Streptococcus salivarius]